MEPHRNHPAEISLFTNTKLDGWHLVVFPDKVTETVTLHKPDFTFQSVQHYTDKYTEAVEFCYRETKQGWYKELRRFWFENAEEAIVFKLRFC